MSGLVAVDVIGIMSTVGASRFKTCNYYGTNGINHDKPKGEVIVVLIVNVLQSIHEIDNGYICNSYP